MDKLARIFIQNKQKEPTIGEIHDEIIWKRRMNRNPCTYTEEDVVNGWKLFQKHGEILK